MRLLIDDAVLLALTVLFFAVQQRQRPEGYFRFWLTGWVLVLVSVMARLALHGAAGQPALESLCQDALVCGGIAFQFSSIVSEQKRRTAIVAACAISLPVCFGLDMIVAGRTSAPPLVLVALLGEGIALACARPFLHARSQWLFPAVASLCAVHGALMIDLVVRGKAAGVYDVVLCQIFLTAGLLLHGRRKARAGQWLGSFGFLGWGLSHLLVSPFFAEGTLPNSLNDLWLLPKYLVAFGMVLRLFAEKNSEIAGLGLRYRSLYEELRVLYQGNPHPMWIYEVETLRFLSVNDAAVQAYGFPEEEFLGLRVSELLAPGDKEYESMYGEEPRKAPARHRRANGMVFDVDLTEHAISFQGLDARFVLAVDITEREDVNRDLMYRAQHDLLTGLPNRMVLEDRLMHWLARCGREGSMGAVLTVDIDHFKEVNDTYGHLVGDECLKITAERLRSRVRQVDTIARTGGEEFTIVIGNLRNRDGAEKVCSVLLQVFEEPITLESGHSLKVTVSIGAAMYPEDGTDVESLRRRSDEALYQAKRSGRNCAVFSTTPDQPGGHEPLRLPSIVASGMVGVPRSDDGRRRGLAAPRLS